MKRETVSLTIFLAVSMITQCLGLVGYDCGGGTMNITSFSLLDIQECKIPVVKPNETMIEVQLLQLVKYQSILVYECLVEIDRQIDHCGMFSHIGRVPESRRKYFHELDYRSCKDLHTTGMVRISDKIAIHGLKANTTTTHTVQLAGDTSRDGTCDGEGYTDTFGTYKDVVVEAVIKISYASYTASVNMETDAVELRSGARCKFVEGSCIDTTGGHVFWDEMPIDNCGFDQYKVLYQGKAKKLSATEEEPEVYVAENYESTFALMAKGRASLCGYTIIKTEIPKLFILEVTPGNTFPRTSKIATEDLDIFLYMNSKFVYVERHIRAQVQNLYHHTRVRRCELERSVLKNALALAHVAPELLPQVIKNQPGYLAVMAGEIVHLVKCSAVEVQFRKTQECYLELPVYYKNDSYFMQPKTHTLTQTGTPVDCNAVLPTGYFIDGNWYYFTPESMLAHAPQIIGTSEGPAWNYKNPENLATNGIYDQHDLDRLRQRIMTRAESPAILHTLARGAMGHVIPPGSISLTHLMDRTTLNQIMSAKVQQFWDKFLIFGSATSGIIGILTLIHVVKLVMNTIIHGYTIYNVYGWSVRLIGALWHSLTLLFVHKAVEKNIERNRNETETPLQRQRSLNNILSSMRKEERKKENTQQRDTFNV